jgi:hypothetical protein
VTNDPNVPKVALHGVTASDIADLTSVLIDMQSARRHAELYLKQSPFPAGDPRGEIRQALWAASVISYRRFNATAKSPHKKGQSRLGLDKNWTQDLTPELLAAHQKIDEIANRHIAHRVNRDMQQVVVYAELAPPPQPPEVVDVETRTQTLVRPDPALVHHLIAICEHLITDTRRRRDTLRANAIGYLNTHDLSQVYEGDPPEI